MEQMIKVGQAAKMLGVCIKTLQTWDNKGLLKAYRTPTNCRYYKKSQLEEFTDEKNQKHNRTNGNTETGN